MHEHESDPVIEDVASTPPPPQSPAGNGKGNGAAEAIPADVVELVFKGRRRAYYANPREIPLREGDYVIVQAERGEDLGRVHHTAEWVRRPELYGNLRHVLRSARPEDLETLDRNRAKEERAFQICKEILQAAKQVLSAGFYGCGEGLRIGGDEIGRRQGINKLARVEIDPASSGVIHAFDVADCRKN